MVALKDKDLFRQQALIGGHWRDASAKATVDVIDPASQQVLGTIPDMGCEETRAAINAAVDAFKHWRTKAHAERAALLERWYELMRHHEQDLALLLTLEQGKPLAESLGEIRYGASFVKWFAEEARRINGSTIPSPTVDRRILVLKEPVGVCGIITPWNFPNAMITRKVAPALAAGCTVVIKPSEFTPFSALAIAVLAERAGIPAGVINIVTGMPAEIGQELMANETVRKLSFTGSTRVGALLMKGAADSIKGSASSSAATRRSSSLTMPISIGPSRARLRQNSAMAARPASAAIAFSCNQAFMMPLHRSSPARSRK